LRVTPVPTATESDPAARFAMADVMVMPPDADAGPSALADPLAPPATNVTNMVSPSARLAPTMSAAVTPETAAGSTTRTVVPAFRAPKPTLASLSELGTAESASSVTEAMIGMVRMPTPTPAANSVYLLSSTPSSAVG